MEVFMKILGVVTEYNPFHNGHLYHLQRSLEITGATHTVAIMSGNFLQRGEPALVDKWERAKMAVKSGVDLVLELPTTFACATAEIFASGAVSLLDNLGIIDFMSFGSEYGRIDILEVIAKTLLLSPPDYNDYIKNYLQQGLSFPLARSHALKDYFEKTSIIRNEFLHDISNILNNPNNILAIEYIKALKKINSPIIPYTVPRVKATYHSKEIRSNICSATAIREGLKKEGSLEYFSNVMPDSSYAILKSAFNDNVAPIFDEDFATTIITILRRMSATELALYFDVEEGLENRILNCSQNSNSLLGLYNCIKSKRYTLTRIQRICMHVLLNLHREDIQKFVAYGGPQYIRVLAFNNKGREILKLCKSKSSLPIINKISNYIPQNDIAKKMLDLDIRASNIYSIAMKDNYHSKISPDFYISPHYEKTHYEI